MTRRDGTREVPVDPLCPDAEILAAWVDQGLGTEERAQVEAHLVGCGDCRVLMAHVLETQDAVSKDVAGSGAPPAPRPVLPGAVVRPPIAAPSRTLMRRSVLAILATAAAVLVAVGSLQRWPGSISSGAESKLADLADAVGQERTVEARLTGGFRYGPLRAPARSGGSSATTDNWKLYGAAGKIREDAEQDPSAPNLHALGVAHLLIGDYDAAVQALEDASAEDAVNARYQSDLAAAYLARAKQLDRPDDLPRALGAAEKAVAQDGQLLEAHFNRALALESLFLEEQARRAWEDYLARDPTSPWAEDARRHLAALQRTAAAVDRVTPTLAPARPVPPPIPGRQPAHILSC